MLRIVVGRWRSAVSTKRPCSVLSVIMASWTHSKRKYVESIPWKVTIKSRMRSDSAIYTSSIEMQFNNGAAALVLGV